MYIVLVMVNEISYNKDEKGAMREHIPSCRTVKKTVTVINCFSNHLTPCQSV